MLGYLVPVFVMFAVFAGAQLTFGHVWLSILMTAGVGLMLPYGGSQAKLLIVQLIELPKTIRSRKRRHLRRHRYS